MSESLLTVDHLVVEYPGKGFRAKPFQALKGVNLDIATKLRKYYGANVIGLDFLDLDETAGEACSDSMFWSHGAKILAAAAFARDNPRLHIVYITNFKCGPDSYIKHFTREAAGAPLLVLQFDGPGNDAGYMTRCEAYLDSKGILRCYKPAPPPESSKPESRAASIH